MNSFNRVMLATDLSNASDRLTDCLFEICPDIETEVVVAHVITDDEDADPHSSGYKQIQLQLKKYEDDFLRAGYENVRVITPSGEAIEEIKVLTETHEPDLLFLASHGKGFLRRAFQGSTTFDLVSITTCPLFILKEDEMVLPEHLLKKVVVPTDFSKESLAALNIIRSLREQIEEVIFVHVIEKTRNDDERDEKRKKAEQKLNELAEEVRIFGMNCTVRVAKGTASKQTQKIADKVGATMIVLAKVGQGYKKGKFLGSTAQNIIVNTDTPVLLLPLVEENTEEE